MKVVFTGSREMTSDVVIRECLRLAWGITGSWTEFHHGGARGADTVAASIVGESDVKVIEWPADWDQYGRGAGLIRNSEMLDRAQPHWGVAIWLDESAGTKHCINEMQKRHIPRIVFYYQTVGMTVQRVGLTKVTSDGLEVRA